MLVLLIVVLASAESQVISTTQGKLRGAPQHGFVSYNGIPYASLTNATERFKIASLAPLWSGIRESTQLHCTAFSNVEDCLHLDVHVPSTGKASWPVLVWVKDGSTRYYPDKLVQEDVIVVIVSHRTGPIGFLCFGDEKIPGNAGVKDVVLALRWVRDNIIAFNGNPNKVIVAGQSSGAAIVEAILLSPMAQNLFHGAIMQSGSILSPWAFNYDAKERATALGNILSDTEDVKSTLLSSRAEELVIKSDKLDIPYLPFGVCIENAFKNEERLLSEAPIDLLKKKGNIVPLIMGYNTNEAYIFVSMLKQLKVLKRITEDLSLLLPDELKFMNERELSQVVREIRDVYFKNNITMTSLLAYHRDAYFVNHMHRSFWHHASSHSPVYYYQFSYVGGVGVKPEPGVKKTGAVHSDELAYLFPDLGKTFEGDDGTVQKHLVQMWTNFVKFLTPTQSSSIPHWESTKPPNPRVMDINTELKMIDYPHTLQSRVWDEIYEKFYYSKNRNSI